MKRIIALCCLAGGLLSASGAEAVAKQAALSKSVPAGWSEDYAAARQEAKKANKKILLAFSGSDWCPWCVKMEKDVYAQAAFVKGAKRDFVLVMIDTPSDKSILSPLAAKQNPELCRQFGIRGYPCSVVTDGEGRELARFSGYQRGGPEAFLETIRKAVSGK